MSKVVPPRFDALATHHNRWGYRGVERNRGKFRAVVGDRVWHSPCFDTPGKAARAYDRMARKVYGELAYLNFPRRGERRVRAADPDLCCRGHERALHTYVPPDGGAGYCRACNKLSQARAKARRKAQT
jgi:hypothetical protein